MLIGYLNTHYDLSFTFKMHQTVQNLFAYNLSQQVDHTVRLLLENPP